MGSGGDCCGVHKILKMDQAVRLPCDPEMRKTCWKKLCEKLKRSKVLRPTRHRTGYFGDVFPSQSVGSVVNKRNQATRLRCDP